MELEFMSNPFAKSDILPATLTEFCSISTHILYHTHPSYNTENCIQTSFLNNRLPCEIISIPDVQKDRLQAVQTHSIGMRASFVGIVCLYEDPIAHVLLCACKVSNSSVSVIRLVVQMN